MVREVLHPIETLRTAPIQLGFTALTSVDAVVMVANHIPHTIEDFGVTALLAGGMAFNGALAVSKIRLRNRVEGALGRLGFDERAMSLTTTTYCGRQATRVACENYGYAEEYDQLCAERAEESQLTWLPQV